MALLGTGDARLASERLKAHPPRPELAFAFVQPRLLVLLAVAATAAPGSASASDAATAATLPPSLLALEQKMGEIRITSERFAVTVRVSAPKGLEKLLKLITGGNSFFSGEVTVSPPAANLTLTLFGHPITLRQVGNAMYLYVPQLARSVHGRRWLKLGPRGLEELVTVNGHPLKRRPKPTSKPTLPSLARPPFAHLIELLAGASEVREVGPVAVGGQSATQYLATLQPNQLARTNAGGVGALEVSIAPNGVPVRMELTEVGSSIATTTIVTLPTVNFPLVIAPPSAAETLTIAQARALERSTKHKPRPGSKSKQ